MLRCFGATIGRSVHIYPSATIWMPWNIAIGDESAVGDHVILYALGPITIGSRVTISQGAHLCSGTHDYRDPSMPLVKKPIKVCDGSWIAADAFIGPGVSIGENCIIGARAVIPKSVPSNSVVVGNPGRVVKKRSLGNCLL